MTYKHNTMPFFSTFPLLISSSQFNPVVINNMSLFNAFSWINHIINTSQVQTIKRQTTNFSTKFQFMGKNLYIFLYTASSESSLYVQELTLYAYTGRVYTGHVRFGRKEHCRHVSLKYVCIHLQ